MFVRLVHVLAAGVVFAGDMRIVGGQEQIGKLTASDAESGDQFGTIVSA